MSGMDWSMNFSSDSNHFDLPYGYSRDGMSETRLLKNPVVPKDNSNNSKNAAELAKSERLKTRKLWEAARSPVSTLLMGCVTMYMTGSRISIFSLIMITMFTVNLFKGLFSLNNVFKPFNDMESSMLFMPKFVYCVLYFIGIGIALFKFNSLGLLPTTASDWYIIFPLQKIDEHSIGGEIY